VVVRLSKIGLTVTNSAAKRKINRRRLPAVY